MSATSGSKPASFRAPRQRHLHSRRNPGPGHHYPRHQRRHAAPRRLRGRSQEALHAPLQLPAVLGRRSCIHAWCRPARNRSRCARRRAVAAVLPTEIDKWPYAMRVVSDILSRTDRPPWPRSAALGLSLMDAGVPSQGSRRGRRDGSGEGRQHYAILTDIAGAEDHYGDMDFKVAGTREGITALQMDIKWPGHHAADHARSHGTRPTPAGSTFSARWKK